MADNVLSKHINGYRAGETLPLKLSRGHILNMAGGLQDALNQGMPQIGVDNYIKKVLLEGRVDAGTNGYNYNNPQANSLQRAVLAVTNNPEVSNYAAAVLDKSQVAKRLGIPFELAWNGTGKTSEADGKRHSARAELFNNVEKDSRNADLVDTVRRAISGELSPQENLSILSPSKLEAAFFGERTQRDKNYPTLDSHIVDHFGDMVSNRLNKLAPVDKTEAIKQLAKGGDNYWVSTNISSALPEYYKMAAGLEVSKPISDYYNNLGYGAKAVIDSLTGKDPDMAEYKSTVANSRAQRYPPGPPPEPGFLSFIKSAFSFSP